MATSEVMSTIGPFLAWTFLPNVITKVVLKFVYGNKILTLPTTQSQAELHAKRIRTLVILSYLFYTIYASLFQREDNFYELLGVSLDSETDTIRRSFRKLAMIHHPDKVGGGPKSERLFINLRRGHDCLVEPVKRMAYDRFGQHIALSSGTDGGGAGEAFTTKEFLQRGLQNNLSFYVVNPLVFGLIRWFSSSQRMMDYWQFSLLLLMLSMELSLIVSPHATRLLAFFPRQTTQYDLISALHTTYIAITLASQHLSPLLPSPKEEGGDDEIVPGWRNQAFDKSISEMKGDLDRVRQSLFDVNNSCRALKVESERAYSYSLLPFRPNEEAATTPGQADNDKSSKPEPTPTSPQSPSKRKLTASEETYLHLLARRIYRPGLSAKLAQQQQQQQQSSSPNAPPPPPPPAVIVEEEKVEKDKSEASEASPERQDPSA